MFHGRRVISSFIFLWPLWGLLNASVVLASGPIFNGGFFNSSKSSQNWWRNGATLDMDFSKDVYYLNGTSYTGISNFITAAGGSFTRSTSAYYWNSSGTLTVAAANAPRLDYDPATNEPKGVLIEEASTNKLLQSSDLTTATWSKSNVTVTANSGTAPDGSNTAFLVTALGTGNSYMGQGIAGLASTTVTRTLYAKAGTTSNVIFEFIDTTNCANYCVATFNLSTPSATWNATRTGQGSVVLTKLSNGWYRLRATFTYSAAGSGNFGTYIGAYGNGTGNVLIWGPQLETKAFPTSYIATTTAAASRSADSFSIPTATWYNATTGTFLARTYGELNSTQTNYNRVVGTDSNRALLSFDSTLSKMNIWNGGTSTIATGTVTASPTQAVKGASSFDAVAGTVSVSMSSAALTTASVAGPWAYNYIYPGGSNYDPVNASVSRVTFFPVKMPDAFLKDYTR